MGTLLNVMFAGEHPVLTFFLAMFVYSLTIRVLRAAVVAIRGWPPAHIDADGCRPASHLTPNRLPTLTPPIAVEVIVTAKENGH